MYWDHAVVSLQMYIAPEDLTAVCVAGCDVKARGSLCIDGLHIWANAFTEQVEDVHR